jgi:hypothetical protein
MFYFFISCQLAIQGNIGYSYLQVDWEYPIGVQASVGSSGPFAFLGSVFCTAFKGRFSIHSLCSQFRRLVCRFCYTVFSPKFQKLCSPGQAE